MLVKFPKFIPVFAEKAQDRNTCKHLEGLAKSKDPVVVEFIHNPKQHLLSRLAQGFCCAHVLEISLVKKPASPVRFACKQTINIEAATLIDFG